MTTNWVVLKFGGTSVSGLPQWTAIATLLQQRLSAGYRVLVVCSAVAGVTNALSALAEEPESEEKLAGVLHRHRQLASELGVTENSWLEQAESTLRRCTSALIEGAGYTAQTELLALGEWLSTRIGAIFLQRFTAVSWVDVREALQVLDEPELSPARQWLSAMRFFDDHPLLMLSQSANDLCLSMLINARDHEILLQKAHAILIPPGPEAPGGVFGARWLEILGQEA